MLQGTGSDVGKSVLVAGLARAYIRRGYRVLPFKPQNMSNNAAVADDGGEIGRAQWLQALACRVPPSVHMNPVLLKPQSDIGAQIIVHGKLYGTADAADYQERKKDLLDAVMTSFYRLKQEADLVIVEGAGSPAETNLRAGDIANMGFAVPAGVPVIMVGDIDRGGVIASLVGTHAVLDAADRKLVKGFLINKFRGDVSLFDAGLQEIERRTNWQGYGVLPWVNALSDLPAEDAVILERPAKAQSGQVKIAVPMLSRIANFDDVDPLRAETSVDLHFVPPGRPLPGDADLVILPGTKATIADLDFFRAQGWEVDLAAHLRRGGKVLGLCGGFQMLGESISDPQGLEGAERKAAGLGLLQMRTVMHLQKQIRNVSGTAIAGNVAFSGYEIHTGQSEGTALHRPYLQVEGEPHGAVSLDGNIMGAYVHGLFESGPFRRYFLAQFGADSDGQDHIQKTETALNALADEMERVLDLDGLIKVAATAPST